MGLHQFVVNSVGQCVPAEPAGPSKALLKTLHDLAAHCTTEEFILEAKDASCGLLPEPSRQDVDALLKQLQMHFITGWAPFWDGSMRQQVSVCLVQSLHDEHQQKLELHRQYASECASDACRGEGPAAFACLCWTVLTRCWGDAELSTALYNYGSAASLEPLLARKYLELAIQSAKGEALKTKYRRKLQEVAPADVIVPGPADSADSADAPLSSLGCVLLAQWYPFPFFRGGSGSLIK